MADVTFMQLGSYPGPLPLAPTPPAVAATAYPAGAPAPGLNLRPIILIVAGDVDVTSSQLGALSIQRR